MKIKKPEKYDPPADFIRGIIAEDIRTDKHKGRVATRFPPEPNGYLHIGHAKSICLNFGIALEIEGGVCHLRFDDTNPSKEDVEFTDSIQQDVRWLGFDWGDHLYFASDYFDKLYQFAEDLIRNGKAYIDHLSAEEIRSHRGTLTEPGKDSPYRNRPVEENLDLFRRMKNGEFEAGECVLRAKIDMASPNLTLRDPTLYRIRKTAHHRTGDKWCIYPMYDFTHCISDALERITHSICTLEFENNRPLYDWVLDNLDVPSHPQQIEFARLNVNYTITSKRKLQHLVEKKFVTGWDDPRMPTITGLRRRGFTPESIRNFCDRIGLAKRESVVDYGMLEHCLREDLNIKARRVMAVLDPLKVVITNYPEGETEWLDAINNPEDESMGTRKIPFCRELYIEASDFREDPPKKYFRLAPGIEVRLKHAYYIKCEDVIKDEKTGKIVELRCVYDPETRGGWSKDGRRIKGTLHWVSAPHALNAELRLYDYLFTCPNPSESESGKEFTDNINPNSLVVLKNSKVEPCLKDVTPETPLQFLRTGYFCMDNRDSKSNALVFNRSVSLKDSWAKIEKSQS